MQGKHRKTLQMVFSTPTPQTLEWRRIEALLLACGAELIEGDGSRVAFAYSGNIVRFHRPHPHKEAKPYQVRDARHFLTLMGVKP
ncbi:MAG: type II toxin-antitoxin system HicA family toxin [Mariprofundales bacterium]